MKCPKCGYENPENLKDLKYCSMCYEPFQKPAQQAQSAAPANPFTPESGTLASPKNLTPSGNPMFSANMYQQTPGVGSSSQNQQTPNMAPPIDPFNEPSLPVPKQSPFKKYLTITITGLISMLFVMVGPTKMFRSIFVLIDTSAHSQKDFKDDITGLKIECPPGWGWVLVTSEAEMTTAYDLQSLVQMGAKPIVAVRNKLYDSHLVFINFPKHLFGGSVPKMPDAFGRFSDGMSQTPDMKDFKYTGDDTLNFGAQQYLQRAFSTTYKGVDIEGFFGILERTDSFVILLSMYEKKNAGPSKNAFTETKNSIRLDPAKDPIPYLGY